MFSQVDVVNHRVEQQTLNRQLAVAMHYRVNV
jgi:hypothetical protein